MATTALGVEFVELRPLTKTSFGHKQDGCVISGNVTRDNSIVARLQFHTPNTGRRATHRSNIAFVEPDRHTGLRNHENVVGAIRLNDFHQFIVIVQVDRNEAIATARVIRVERCLLYRALACGEEQEAFTSEIAGVDDCLDVLIGLEWQQVDDRHSLCRPLALGNIKSTQSVDATAVREEQQMGVSCGENDMTNDVVLFQFAA